MAKVRVPLNVKTQKSIASMLSSFDKRIEVNTELNKTLEAMAQAMFKSWFVDFDPVIDNALASGNPIPEPFQARAERRKRRLHEGQSDLQPMPAELRQLFPDTFVETDELGCMPKGWKKSEIGKELENVGGGTPSTTNSDYWENGKFSFCAPKDMSLLKSLILNETDRHLTEAGVAKISSGLLPPGTVLMSSRAPIGYVAVADKPLCINQGIIALKPNKLFSSLFLVCWVKDNLPRIIDRANGSTFLEISKSNFRAIPFLVPNEEVLNRFNETTAPMMKRVIQINIETKLLQEIRDSLLPKLLSGQLRIPDSESLLEEEVA